jgi:hypothetical protein
MDLDNEIKEQSTTFAKDLVDQLKKNALDPEIRALSDEEITIKEDLRSWGFFEKYPVIQEEWDDLYVSIIAMNKYKTLKYAKDHPPQPKKTKWEFVMGRMGKNQTKSKK